MAALQEQVIEWLRGQKSMQNDPAFFEQASSFVPTIPSNPSDMPYCPVCKSVLCGACGHCHRLDVVSFSRPDCPNDNDDMGANCAAWYQALNAVWTVQRTSEESEGTTLSERAQEPALSECPYCHQLHDFEQIQLCPLNPKNVVQ